ncbi:class I SAM-dependent methyltransferase [Lolliginicoccus suaedae]|uniref:class I SAM-dependent methyltransferase n=1 Tax=Lolliginicoccus suaedae TaxID=2605429 RepID=UPI0011ED7898|nr:class I SAM-dependent methyltransferase [Lolliginicoccus suaedae]
MSPASINSWPNQRDPSVIVFEVFSVAYEEFDLAQSSLELTIKCGRDEQVVSLPYSEVQKRHGAESYTVMETWRSLVSDADVKQVLDVGGRARSGVSHKDIALGKNVVITDIIEADDVDIVADIHELSQHVEEKFDAFMSIAVFEHLVMPWKAVVELNKVLRTGAVGLVVTHQTEGLHDVPWDFYRYSSDAWKGLFNKRTGFEIVDTGMRTPMGFIRLRWNQRNTGTTFAVGYQESAVVVRKIGEPEVDWPVSLASLVETGYPGFPEGR